MITFNFTIYKLYILDTFNIYDKIILWAGGGALVPITSFGHSLVHGALAKANSLGIVGIIAGMFDLTASGITSAMIFTFIFSLFFQARDGDLRLFFSLIFFSLHP